MSQVNGKKQIYVTEITDFSTTAKDNPGDIREDAAGNLFRYVKNLTASALVVGDVVFHGTSFTNSFYGDVFSFGQSGKGAVQNMMAGVAVSAIPASSFGWIQIKGYNASVHVESTTDILINDALKGVTGQVYVVKDVANAAAPTSSRHIIALAGRTADSEGLIAGEIRCY